MGCITGAANVLVFVAACPLATGISSMSNNDAGAGAGAAKRSPPPLTLSTRTSKSPLIGGGLDIGGAGGAATVDDTDVIPAGIAAEAVGTTAGPDGGCDPPSNFNRSAIGLSVSRTSTI